MLSESIVFQVFLSLTTKVSKILNSEFVCHNEGQGSKCYFRDDLKRINDDLNAVISANQKWVLDWIANENAENQKLNLAKMING